MARPSGSPESPGAPSAAALKRVLKQAGGDPLPTAGARIGLLGGSFNPTHDGHLEISRTALARLSLDEVWWLVSPQNPLKSAEGMAGLEERLARARAAADRPGIRVTALESALGTRFTIDTVAAVKRSFPKHHFVWLMGADNLVQLPHWKNWEQLFARVAIAVIARPGYSRKALAGTAAKAFADHRLAERDAARLAETPPPAWVFLRGPRNPNSSTAIRKRAAKRDGS